MSDTVMAIESTPSTKAGRCASAWGTARTSDSAQTANRLCPRRDCGRDSIISPSYSKFVLLVPRMFRARDPKPLQQVVAHPHRIRHDGQCRVHRRTRWEKASIHHIEVIDIVRFAISVEHRSLRIMPETYRAVLMGDAGERNLLSDIQVPPKQPLMALVAMHRAVRLLHGLLQLGLQSLVRFQIVRCVS